MYRSRHSFWFSHETLRSSEEGETQDKSPESSSSSTDMLVGCKEDKD